MASTTVGAKPTPARAAPAGRLTKLARSAWRAREVYLFLIPTFILLMVFRYYPAFLAIYESFFEWDGYKINVFVGLQNYREILVDPFFWLSVRNVLIIVAFGATIHVLMPILVAEAIYNLASLRMQAVLRTVILIPAIVPGIVHILLWGYIYQPTDGLLNTLLTRVGLESLRQVWLGDPRIALLSIIFVGFPWVGGVWVLILLAGLQNIPQSVIEASIIDGAGRLRRVFAMDIPLIVGQIKLFVILGIIGGLQNFYNILILTNGGPAFATLVPGLYLYRAAFNSSRLGYASAVGVLIFLTILGLTYLNWKYLRSSVEYEAS